LFGEDSEGSVFFVQDETIAVRPMHPITIAH
jgi:hypothetical protein